MNRLLAIISLLLIKTVTLVGQSQSTSPATVRQKIKTEIKTPDSVAVSKTTKEIKQTIKQESKSLKSSLKTEFTQSLPDTTKLNTKKISETGKNKLNEKTTNLQYDSDKPDDAPWKKKQFSKDDLNGFDLPSTQGKGNLPSLDKNTQNPYSDKVENLTPNVPVEGKLQLQHTVPSKVKPAALDKATHIADSTMKVKDEMNLNSVQQELQGVIKIHSKKYIQRLYDSLGLKKGDSLFRVASSLAKNETSKEELLRRINNPLSDKVAFDEKTQSLKAMNSQKGVGGLMKISEKDLSTLKLQQGVLSELKPLQGSLMDSKYMHAIDSMRDVGLKAKRYSLNEKQVTDEMKQTVLEKKPSFIDRSYFELILGFVNDTTFSIVQIAPSWGYHFTNTISVGLGPQIAIQYQEKKLNGVVGFRSFIKAEFFKQRGYFQVEDNIGQSQVNSDALRQTKHSILVGGGGILPISKKIGINLSVFYRVNQKDVQPGGSPWVFRVGLSSIKKIAQK